MDWPQKLLLFGAAALLRLLLFALFPALPDRLSGRVEVSTPVTSFKSCMPSLSLARFPITRGRRRGMRSFVR